MRRVKRTKGRAPRRDRAPRRSQEWADELMQDMHSPSRALPRCAYCGRPLAQGSWHWMRDEWGQMVRRCNDTAACWGRMSEPCRESLKRALRRFGPRGGM